MKKYKAAVFFYRLKGKSSTYHITSQLDEVRFRSLAWHRSTMLGTYVRQFYILNIISTITVRSRSDSSDILHVFRTHQHFNRYECEMNQISVN